VQPEKQRAEIDSIDAGIQMERSDKQLANADFSILET
jgi:hypothetical protein